jgi:GDP-6-deoxy-D-talose 4-dehydrogenase
MRVIPKILITGIDGFTGKYLSAYFSRMQYIVYGLSFFRKDEKKKVFQGDITNKEQLEQIVKAVNPDYIIHLAAISFVPHENHRDLYNVNVLGTQNILDVCIALNLEPRKIIIASSASVYGNVDVETLSEDFCPAPNTHYGNSKLSMEHIVRTYFDDLNILIVRPFNYTGPGQASHFVIPKIVDHFKENRSVIELGNINVYREYNDIHYLVEIYHQLMLHTYKSDVVNICSGNAISLNDVIALLRQITGNEIEIKVNPKFIRKNETETLSGSTRKLQSILGSLPTPIPLRTTLQSMIDS